MDTTSKLLEEFIVAGSGVAVGVFAVLTIASAIAAVKARGWKERFGHVCLAVARLGGAVTVGLVAEALYRGAGGVPQNVRTYAYAAAICGIALGYVGALVTRTAPR